MSDFVRREKDAPRIPAMLVSRLIGFAEAPEYRNLRQYELDIPGVVCGAFAQYVCRLFLVQREIGDARLQRALNVLEELSASCDPETIEMVVTEVLENLDLNRQQMAVLKSVSGQKTKELIDKWILRTQS